MLLDIMQSHKQACSFVVDGTVQKAVSQSLDQSQSGGCMRHAQKQHQSKVTKCDEPRLRMGFQKVKSQNQTALHVGLTHATESQSVSACGCCSQQECTSVFDLQNEVMHCS